VVTPDKYSTFVFWKCTNITFSQCLRLSKSLSFFLYYQLQEVIMNFLTILQLSNVSFMPTWLLIRLVLCMTLKLPVTRSSCQTGLEDQFLSSTSRRTLMKIWWLVSWDQQVLVLRLRTIWKVRVMC
jgi:hypothetical protein